MSATYIKLIDAKTAAFTSSTVTLEPLADQQAPLPDVHIDYDQSGDAMVVVEASLGLGSAFQPVDVLTHSVSKRMTGYPVMRMRLTDVQSGTHTAGIFGAFGGASSGSGQEILQSLGLTGGLQFCLDAGDAASYTSGNKWLDLSGNGQDFFLGGSGSGGSDDPTFNGTPGGLSSSEYWSFNGSQFFRYDTSNETWMNALHKDGAKYTLLLWLYPVSSGDTQDLFADNANAVGPGIEWCLGVNASGRPQLFVGNDGAGSANNTHTDTNETYNGWNLVAVSLDETVGSGGGFHYLNGSYNPVSSSNTFNSSYSSPSTSNAGYTFEIGAGGNGAKPVANGTRIAMAMAWSGVALTKTQLDSLWSATRGRFGV